MLRLSACFLGRVVRIPCKIMNDISSGFTTEEKQKVVAFFPFYTIFKVIFYQQVITFFSVNKKKIVFLLTGQEKKRARGVCILLMTD